MGVIVCISCHMKYVVRYLERGHASNPIVQLYHSFVTYLGIDIVYRIEYGKKIHDIVTFVESRL
jgi:hypothetical protein